MHNPENSTPKTEAPEANDLNKKLVDRVATQVLSSWEQLLLENGIRGNLTLVDSNGLDAYEGSEFDLGESY